MDGRTRNLVAFLGAVSMFLATIEYLFPKPVPFMRVGIANLPLLLTLDVLPFPALLMLTTIKVLGQGLVNGTLASYVFLFSASGSYAALVTMWVAHRTIGKRISLIGISVLGALASNLVQTSLSITFIFGQTAWIIAPYFLGIGLFASIVTGGFAMRFRNRSTWFASIRSRYAPIS
jgi:heptaprenyl diphosphate synthase